MINHERIQRLNEIILWSSVSLSLTTAPLAIKRKMLALARRITPFLDTATQDYDDALAIQIEEIESEYIDLIAQLKSAGPVTADHQIDWVRRSEHVERAYARFKAASHQAELPRNLIREWLSSEQPRDSEWIQELRHRFESALNEDSRFMDTFGCLLEAMQSDEK